LAIELELELELELDLDHLLLGLGPTLVILLVADLELLSFLASSTAPPPLLLLPLSTFLALAAVGFMKLEAPFLWTLAALGLTAAGPLTVLGSVVLLAAVPGVAALLLLLLGRDIGLATELREAPELDLLRFSLELVGLVLL